MFSDFDKKFSAAEEKISARARQHRGKGDAPPQGDAHLPNIEGVSVDDFHAYMPQHAYIFVPSRELWPASSVNARIPPIGKSAASSWLDANRAVEQMTWCPGLPTLIENRLVSDGGWIERPGCRCFNLYRPPAAASGDASKARRWIDHVRAVFDDSADHIVCWLAHRAQRPGEKINHALVLGGAQGIGKDTLLEPVKQAIGPWNFSEVSPQQLLGRFNGFLKSTILRVSEARDLGEVDRFAFYDHTKAFTAAPPDVLRIDEKNLREYAIFNICGVIITSNHKTDGIYLPADDRRHFVAWSTRTKDDFTENYWNDLYRWFAAEGNSHVTAYLRALDLSGFNAKAPPPKTQAFWEIVDASRAPEDDELADAIDALGSPEALTVGQVAGHAVPVFAEWLRDRKNARRIPHRFEECGYVAVRNPGDTEGRWKIDGRRHTIYAKARLSIHDRAAAANRLAGAR